MVFTNDAAKPTSTSVSIFNNMQHSPFSIDKLANSYRYRDTGWTIPQAYLALLFLAADADGKFNPEERSQIEMVARRSPALRALLASGELAAHEQAAMAAIVQNPEAAFDTACQTLSNDMVLSVFAHCVDLMLADGDFDDREKAFIEKLWPKLDISVEYARRILEVLLLKGRY